MGKCAQHRQKKENGHFPGPVERDSRRLSFACSEFGPRYKTACALVSQIKVKTKYLTPRKESKWSTASEGQSGCTWPSWDPTAPAPRPSPRDLSGLMCRGSQEGPALQHCLQYKKMGTEEIQSGGNVIGVSK